MEFKACPYRQQVFTFFYLFHVWHKRTLLLKVQNANCLSVFFSNNKSKSANSTLLCLFVTLPNIPIPIQFDIKPRGEAWKIRKTVILLSLLSSVKKFKFFSQLSFKSGKYLSSGQKCNLGKLRMRLPWFIVWLLAVTGTREPVDSFMFYQFVFSHSLLSANQVFPTDNLVGELLLLSVYSDQ